MNGQCPHKWWTGSTSSLRTRCDVGDGLVCMSVGKAHLLSDKFESKQSMD